ncbi:MAG: flagellar FlbD family protein [Proteobacteria bacterium]|nr:flagellar FlbD family protein [Pseudomonadota bacterium]
MLLLTKLDQTRVLVPIESIKYIEETPDTLIRFLNGESVIVRENFSTIQSLSLGSVGSTDGKDDSQKFKDSLGAKHTSQ